QFGDYLGIGAGAHGKLTLANGDVSRAWKIKHPNTYISRANKVGAAETVATQQLPFEFMMNALRLNNGFEIDTFTSRCNLSLKTIQPLLDKHQGEGLIEIEPNRIRPTTFGHNMVNNMLEDYLSLGE
ncbi:MAG: oxygen-independent coproporphyrinogen-3 oxidase, partial [Arenicella sp.]